MNIQENANYSQPSNKTHNIYSGNPATDDSANQAQNVASIFIKDNAGQDSESQAIRVLAEQAGVVNTERASESGLLAVKYNPKYTRGNQILRAVQKKEYERTCIALTYFKDSDKADFENQMVRAVISQSGVFAAERSAHKACVWMVHFDPRQSSGSKIVRALTKEGYAALLVGC